MLQGVCALSQQCCKYVVEIYDRLKKLAPLKSEALYVCVVKLMQLTFIHLVQECCSHSLCFSSELCAKHLQEKQCHVFNVSPSPQGSVVGGCAGGQHHL